LKGRFLESVPEAPSGSIVAAEVRQVEMEGTQSAASWELGVERYLTLCSSTDGPCFETPYSSQAYSIVRVSLEPKHVTDLDVLYRGLRLLHKADPSVMIEAMVTGENVLGCCGDEHLKRCINDLQKLYARGVPLQISTPLVAVRESVALAVDAERVDPKNSTLWLPSWHSHILEASTEASSTLSGPPGSEPEDGSEIGAAAHFERYSMSSSGIMSVWTANRKACLRIGCVPLCPELLEWMDEHAEDLESVVHRRRASLAFAGGREATLGICLREISRQLSERIGSIEEGNIAASLAEMMLSGMSVTKGSRTLLFDATESAWPLWESYEHAAAATESGDAGESGAERIPVWMRHSILTGFQLASNAGPLAEEPMRGVAFVIHGCHMPGGTEEGGDGATAMPSLATPSAFTGAEPYGPFSGQVMASMKEACRYVLFRRGYARICEAMLSLEVQCEQEMLGKVYAVLGKRRVRVLDEGLRDGTSTFHIRSFLPLADSFGMAQDLRSAASGNVAFHMAYSHWEQSEEDPFQEASLTAQELEDLGDQPLPPNYARKLVDAIRKRKGLPTDEKVVSVATKQRTVTKMK